MGRGAVGDWPNKKNITANALTRAPPDLTACTGFTGSDRSDPEADRAESDALRRVGQKGMRSVSSMERPGVVCLSGYGRRRNPESAVVPEVRVAGSASDGGWQALLPS